MSAFSLTRHFLRHIASKYGYQIERKYELGLNRLDIFELAVDLCLPEMQNFFFVQIGANDGHANDPISCMVKKYGWKGILLEPKKAVFEQLVKNYKGFSGPTFRNAALGTTDGMTTL